MTRALGRASVVGDYFASCAHLEAASVVAFDVLADELAAYGAPYDLVASCRDAAIEEVAHAEAVGLPAEVAG